MSKLRLCELAKLVFGDYTREIMYIILHNNVNLPVKHKFDQDKKSS